MQFVLVIYHGNSPLPGSPGWKALPEAERKAIYAEYAELNKQPGITLRLPPIAPDKATTVQVQGGRTQVKNGPHLAEGVGDLSFFVNNVGDAQHTHKLSAVHAFFAPRAVLLHHLVRRVGEQREWQGVFFGELLKRRLIVAADAQHFDAALF